MYPPSSGLFFLHYWPLMISYVFLPDARPSFSLGKANDEPCGRKRRDFLKKNLGLENRFIIHWISLRFFSSIFLFLQEKERK
jgi:hypothetical protein